MTPRKRNIVTGVVVLGAMGFLMWMILQFSGGAMRIFKARGTRVTFECERADGLSDGSPVFFKGVEVGKVTAVHRLEDNERVLIEGELENSPPLPQNLKGLIKAQSSLGTSCEIDLTTDGKATGLLAADQKIPVRYLGSSLFPPELSDMVSEASKQKLVQHVDLMILTLQAQLEKVGKVMDSTQALIGDPKVRDDLVAAMDNIRKVTARADLIAANIETFSKNADRDMNELTRKVGLDLQRIGDSFQQFQLIAEKINKGQGTAGALVNDPKLYDELALTAKQLNAVSLSLARLVDQWEHEGVSIKLNK